MNVRHFLTPAPPATLYHYTTAEGLYGIFTNDEIWATHTQYLNDQREFRHAISLAKEELAQMFLNEQDGARRQKITEMQTALCDSQESINVCVCSFSEDGDSLSQWRAYGGAGGYAIGFKGTHLRWIAEGKDFWLTKCIYEEADQKKLIKLLLEDVLRENVDGGDREENQHLIMGGNLRAYLNRYAPILKHRSFREEKEWRIITRPINCHREEFDYRPSRSLLIPHYKLALSKEGTRVAIDRIMVGPSPHQKRAIQGVRSFLIKQDIASEIEASNTPYRNW